MITHLINEMSIENQLHKWKHVLTNCKISCCYRNIMKTAEPQWNMPLLLSTLISTHDCVKTQPLVQINLKWPNFSVFDPTCFYFSFRYWLYETCCFWSLCSGFVWNLGFKICRSGIMMRRLGYKSYILGRFTFKSLVNMV